MSEHALADRHLLVAEAGRARITGATSELIETSSRFLSWHDSAVRGEQTVIGCRRRQKVYETSRGC